MTREQTQRGRRRRDALELPGVGLRRGDRAARTARGPAMCSAIPRRSASSTASCAAGWDAASPAATKITSAPAASCSSCIGEPATSQFLDAARKLAALNAGFPAGPNGERYHRGDTPGWRWQIWVDCMDVDGPFLAALAHATGEDRYFDQAVGELLGYARTLQSDSGLLFHGFERDCGRNGELWARGNGWALMGLVDTLDPAAALARPRGPNCNSAPSRSPMPLPPLNIASGLWHTVINDSATYLESTLATMAAYALREGVAHGVLDASRYDEMERKARAAMHTQIAADGALQLVSDATPVGARAVYATRPFGTFPWGQGPLLLALCQEVE